MLDNDSLAGVQLDKHLGWWAGRQFPPRDAPTFGVFADASPDRWGRLLMQRRLERDIRAGLLPARTRLHESDYLLGVHDLYRLGALRFRRADQGAFLDDQHDQAAPPFVRLRELESASLALERDEDNTAAAGSEWLRLLIAPGGSLGGARPKASVVDPDNQMWMAKFPSVHDDHDLGAWECVLHTLARGCGIRVPESLARRFGSRYHTFLIRRFDRAADGGRLHFASAMTLTGHQDGDDAESGVSYLELAQVLIEHGAETAADLRELWRRVLFNVLVANTDDHLRNHGFLLEPGRGWRLSEAYDMNPVPQSVGLSLNITEADNALDLQLPEAVAPLFRVTAKDARQSIATCRAVVSQWRRIASKLGISKREQDYMAPAFQLA
jgi:serine/threonine-protein kinase HipA